jgi:hypothetical protein
MKIHTIEEPSKQRDSRCFCHMPQQLLMSELRELPHTARIGWCKDGQRLFAQAIFIQCKIAELSVFTRRAGPNAEE